MYNHSVFVRVLIREEKNSNYLFHRFSLFTCSYRRVSKGPNTVSLLLAVDLWTMFATITPQAVEGYCSSTQMQLVLHTVILLYSRVLRQPQTNIMPLNAPFLIKQL